MPILTESGEGKRKRICDEALSQSELYPNYGGIRGIKASLTEPSANIPDIYERGNNKGNPSVVSEKTQIIVKINIDTKIIL